MGCGSVSTRIIPIQQRLTECFLGARFLLGMGDSVKNKMDKVSGSPSL